MVFIGIMIGRVLFILTLGTGAAFNLIPLRDMIILEIEPEENLESTSF